MKNLSVELQIKELDEWIRSNRDTRELKRLFKLLVDY
jgi:hypothetical protein